ncbi:MAG TPA: hypothetical protein DEG69_02085, partial [Flavobacteriaceae bacterium]|nr:hypothetical protein [Flavobacteriaceae bacterium]
MIKRMSPDTYRIIMALILSGILPRTVKTNKAVELINDKKYHRAKLYRDDLKEILGARRVG